MARAKDRSLRLDIANRSRTTGPVAKNVKIATLCTVRKRNKKNRNSFCITMWVFVLLRRKIGMAKLFEVNY